MVIEGTVPTLPPGPSEPSPSSAELALSRSLEREGRCRRPLASSWARALCKLLSSLTVSGTAKSRSANQGRGTETRYILLITNQNLSLSNTGEGAVYTVKGVPSSC